MLPIEVPFPHVGSRAFERETGRQLTIIRRHADGALFCRRDDRPRGGYARTGPASGNVTLAACEVVGSIDETALGIAMRKRTASTKAKTSEPRSTRRGRK